MRTNPLQAMAVNMQYWFWYARNLHTRACVRGYVRVRACVRARARVCGCADVCVCGCVDVCARSRARACARARVRVCMCRYLVMYFSPVEDAAVSMALTAVSLSAKHAAEVFALLRLPGHARISLLCGGFIAPLLGTCDLLRTATAFACGCDTPLVLASCSRPTRGGVLACAQCLAAGARC